MNPKLIFLFLRKIAMKSEAWEASVCSDWNDSRASLSNFKIILITRKKVKMMNSLSEHWFSGSFCTISNHPKSHKFQYPRLLRHRRIDGAEFFPLHFHFLFLFCFVLFCLFFIFSFIFISWRLITLQYRSGFCHTLTWISHGLTCVPYPDPPLPPPSPSHPSGSSQCPAWEHLSHASNLSWWSVSP